jgi:hypothetical protein
MNSRKGVEVLLVALLFCNWCYPNLQSSGEFSIYEEYLGKLTDVTKSLLKHMNIGDIHKPGRGQQGSYNSLNKLWNEWFNQMADMIDKEIPKMANRLGLGGMDARNQQLVKETKLFIQKVGGSLFIDLKNGVKDPSTIRLRLDEIKKAIEKIKAKSGDKLKTVEIKETLETVLSMLSNAYQKVIAKASGAIIAK